MTARKERRIDMEEVRAFLRRLPDKDVYRLLDRAIDLLPAYFQSLAETSEPKEFAEHSANAIDDFVEYDRNRYFFNDYCRSSTTTIERLSGITWGAQLN